MSTNRGAATDPAAIVPAMGLVPHAPGYTLAADAFMRPSENVGFSIAHQLSTVFMHYHEFYELGLVVSGTGIHLSSSGEERIRRGSAIFVVPGVGHGYRVGEELVVHNYFLRAEAARFDLPWVRRDPRLARLFGPAGVEPRDAVVLSLGERAFDECLAHLESIRERPPEERSEAHDLGHLLLALDSLARECERADREVPGISPRMSTLVASAIDLLDHDLARHWTLDELAAQVFVGQFHLVRQFKRWVGLPPIAYLNRRRAERAATLLATTDGTIAEIGAQVGWPDPSHFSRRFHQHIGVSPRAYRVSSRTHFARETEAKPSA